MASEKRDYKVTVSFALGRSSAGFMQDAVQGSERARAKVEADGKRMGESLKKAGKEGGDALAKGIEAGAKKASTASMKEALADEAFARKMGVAKVLAAANAEAARSKAAGKGFDERLKLAQKEQAANEKFFAATKREVEKDEANRVRSANRIAASREKIASARVSMVKDIASDAMGTAGRIASKAMSTGREIAGGLGVDTSLGGNVSKVVDFRRTITDVTNAGMGIQGKLATKSDYNETTKAVDEASDYTKMDRGTVASSLAAFVDKASDIEGGKALLKGLGDVALASGTDMVTLANSAGEVWKMMGNGPNKIENVTRLLAIGAKSGQLGNLAFKELAGSIGRLASQGGSFQGNFNDNFVDLMAISQISAKGGSVGGAQMNRSAQAFAQDLTKKRTIKEFKAQGIDIFADQKADGSGTKLRKTEDIIVDVLRKTNGDMGQLSRLFPGQKSNAVIKGAQNIANEAGGGEAGIEAVKKNFGMYRQAMSKEEIENSANARKEDPDSKANDFNNKMQRLVSSDGRQRDARHGEARAPDTRPRRSLHEGSHVGGQQPGRGHHPRHRRVDCQGVDWRCCHLGPQRRAQGGHGLGCPRRVLRCRPREGHERAPKLRSRRRDLRRCCRDLRGWHQGDRRAREEGGQGHRRLGEPQRGHRQRPRRGARERQAWHRQGEAGLARGT
jgi:hypothetical protein